MIYCEYGAYDNCRNVTDIVLTVFRSKLSNQIHFDSGSKNFNQHFGDPYPCVFKMLRIYVNSDIYIINEDDMMEHNIVLLN